MSSCFEITIARYPANKIENMFFIPSLNSVTLPASFNNLLIKLDLHEEFIITFLRCLNAQY